MKKPENAGRDVFIAGHTTGPVKRAIKRIAQSRKVSISALLHEILCNCPEVRAIIQEPR